MQHLIRIARFALVSGTGLALDFVVFLALVAAGLAPFTANLVSGAGAVTFVYFASVRRIFSYKGTFVVGLFLAYLLYQAAGVTLASAAVHALSQNLVAPGWAKLLILPVTFSANYLFMSFLTRRGAAAGSGYEQGLAAGDGALDPPHRLVQAPGREVGRNHK